MQRSLWWSLFGISAAIGLALPGAVTAPAFAAAAVPDFSGYWVRPESGSGRKFYPPDSGPGPIMNTDATELFQIGDHTSPILLPDAAATVKAHADEGRAGNVIYPPWSMCWPVGVPLILNMAETVQFVQSADRITILYQRDHHVRHIYLDVPHSDAPAISWYGESVGHYESGDTLVVDTIAQDTRSNVDRFGTPHSEEMRVIERYTISPDRQRLEIAFTVEDPLTFTTPWSAKTAYVSVLSRDGAGRENPWIDEVVCAENNRDAAGGDFPIPIAVRADF